MQYAEVLPCPALQPFVRCFWRLRAAGGGGATERILPDGCAELVLNRADPFVELDEQGLARKQPRLLAVGQIRRFLRIAPTGVVDLLGIRFQPAGMHALLGVAAPLTESRIDLGAVDPALARLLDGARDLATVEAVLLSRLPRQVTSIAQAARLLAGATSVERAAAAVGLRRRTFERRFRTEVGLAPREFARIRRFHAVVQAVEATGRTDWAGLAPGAGYCDQSHLIREFRRFAGLAPTVWARTESPLAALIASGA